MWSRDELSFDLSVDDTDDPVVTVRIGTPAGIIQVMAEAEQRGRVLWLKRLHIHNDGPNIAGPANLRLLADAVLERMDYDEIIIEGAVRTTGAGPGRHPHRIRFTRRSGP